MVELSNGCYLGLISKIIFYRKKYFGMDKCQGEVI